MHQIICGDATELIGDYPAHLIVTDPPFNIGFKYHGSKSDRMPERDYYQMLAKVCRPPSVVVHYIESIFKLADLIGHPQKVVPWVYPSNTGRQWRAIAWFGCKPDFRLGSQPYRNPTDKRIKLRIANGKSARLYDWWQVNQVKNVSKTTIDHPCIMPVEVMRRILITTPELPVLDPFAGSGTTLLAAKQLGRKCVGIELSEKYFTIIKERLL